MGYQQQLAERADFETALAPDKVRAAFVRVAEATSFWTGPVRVVGDDEDGMLLEIRGGLSSLITSGLSGFGRQVLVDVSIAPYLEGSQVMVTIADATIAQLKVFMFVPITPKRVTGMTAYRRLVTALGRAISAPASPHVPSAATAPPPAPARRAPARPASPSPPAPRAQAYEPPPAPLYDPASAGGTSPTPAPGVRLTKETVPSPAPRNASSHRPTPHIRPARQRVRRPLVIGVMAVLVACAGGIGLGVAMTRDNSSSSSLAAPNHSTELPGSGDVGQTDATVDPAVIPEPVVQPPITDGPSRILRRHLQRLNSHDYDAAYELMSASYRSKVPTWVDVRAAAEPLINVVDVGKAVVSETTARVPITFYARDTVKVRRSDTTCRRFAGTAHMIKDGSDWRYDPLSNELEVTELPDGEPDCP